ncbi:MAG TPA: hypothetical protein VFO58_04860, partial [Vicinamibacterales bacterium]|nr:hypothetical protein [Vicinamibacterales bacterium]
LRACLDGRGPTQSDAADRPSARVLVAESADHRFVALGLRTGAVVVLDAASGARLTAVEASGRLERLAFNAESRLVIGRSNGRVQVVLLEDLRPEP